MAKSIVTTNEKITKRIKEITENNEPIRCHWNDELMKRLPSGTMVAVTESGDYKINERGYYTTYGLYGVPYDVDLDGNILNEDIE